MKKLLIIILVLLSSVACEKSEEDVLMVVSNVEVTNKGVDDGNIYWISTSYLNVLQNEEEIIKKMEVNDKVLWDSIEINKEYTVHYGKNSDNIYSLYKVEPSNNK
ncbi:hypothetical protein P4H39_32155 [Paenibacillus lautus]|uniref:hypothetical protein n=1 Tax=Paenibacillus lautus TaxID=1401 RepID=UPI002DBEFA5F|nr:hypothetical protein [Paenibacillus lautus]MEC0207266.1 hypothetical protein [Paenibacillus lautus]